MGKSRSGKAKKIGAQPPRRRRVIVTVSLLLSLIATGSILAQQGRIWPSVLKKSEPQTQSAQFEPSSLDPASPSKEYIYAGSRLIATEEGQSGGSTRINPASVTASNSYTGSPPSSAIDGNLSTYWNAGDFAPPTQWIELDLGQSYSISQVRLNVAQLPPGQATHEVLGGPCPNPQSLLYRFNGPTQHGQWLETIMPAAANIRYLRITTTHNVSWVAWAEIEAYGTPGGATCAGNTPPTVSITSPSNGASFPAPANITINANAADSDGQVTQVEFLANGSSIGVDTQAPYSIQWNGVAAGGYSLTARATDNGGLITTSTAVNITVQGQASSPPIAHWRFDENGGLTAQDSSGNGNNGTLQYGPTWTSGRLSSALSFDGIDDYVSVASSASLRNVVNTFTLSFWAYPLSIHETDGESTWGGAGVSGQKYAFGPQQGGIAYGSPDHAGAGVSVGTNGINVYEHSDFYMPALLVYQGSITDWTHITVVYENKQPRLYVNGSLVRTGLTSPKTFVHIATDAIGGMGYGYFNGQIDEMRIYNRPLTLSEIQALASEGGATIPVAPSNLTATAISSSQVNLNWADNSTNETGFKVERKTGINGVWGLVTTVGMNVTSFQDSGLAASTTYYYRIKATNSAGDSSPSNEVSVTTPGSGGTEIIFNESCGLVQPGDVSISCGGETEGIWFDRSFTVSRAANDTVRVRMFNVDDAEYVYVNGISRGSASYAQDITIDLTPYLVVGQNTIRLQVENFGPTPWCYGFTLTKTTGGGGTPPPPPTGLTATPGNGQVSLQWTAPPEATSYSVKRSNSSGGPYSLIQSGIPTTSYTDSGLTNGNTYYYVVSASNPAGEGPNSAWVSATPTAGSGLPPGTCTEVSLFSGNGTPDYLEGLGGAARWKEPLGGVVAKDPVSGQNALFIADTFNHRIRMIYLQGPNVGLSILIAGSGVAGYGGDGDGQDPFQAMYNAPNAIAAITDANGVATALLIADTNNHVIRRLLRPLDGQTKWRPTLFSGNGIAGSDNGPALESRYYNPVGVVVAPDGFIYLADSANGSIRKLNQEGYSWTLASLFNTPVGITVSNLSGNLYVTENGIHNIWQVTTAGNKTLIAGGGVAGLEDLTGTDARFSEPYHLVWANTSGGEVLFIADRKNHRIRKLVISTNAVSTFAGSGAGYREGGCNTAQFYRPRGVALAPAGELYVMDTENNRIRKIQ